MSESVNETLKKYRFNINKIVEFFNVSGKNKETVKEVTDTLALPEDYDSDKENSLILESRIVRQVNSNGDTNIDNIKYDLIKLFITTILSSQQINFGIDIAIQTMINEGLMEEIE